MSSLSNIVTEMKQARPVAAINLETVDPRVRVGMESQKRAALQKLEDLEKKYSQTVWEKAVFVVPVSAKTKEHVEQFVMHADAIGEFMPVNYMAWDFNVGNGWWEANGKKPQNIDTVHTVQLLDSVRKTMAELNLTSVDTPTVPRQIALNTLDECTEAVKSITTQGCGVGFRLALLEAECARVAQKLEWGGGDIQPVPFVLLNATEADVALLSALVPNKFYKSDLSKVKDEVTEEFVANKLESVAKSHKKSK
jgi:hypothetical protein